MMEKLPAAMMKEMLGLMMKMTTVTATLRAFIGQGMSTNKHTHVHPSAVCNAL